MENQHLSPNTTGRGASTCSNGSFCKVARSPSRRSIVRQLINGDEGDDPELGMIGKIGMIGMVIRYDRYDRYDRYAAA